jgi:peptidoglycan/LPS O-acetylase OafA/YrhL
MSDPSPRVYFPGLTGLRFIAAFSVFITHVELIKLQNGFLTNRWVDLWGQWASGKELGQFIVRTTPFNAVLESDRLHWFHPLISQAGSLGVNFFFVLSGFLITFLLLKERSVTNGINVRKFYIRRILRIWPLYYLIVLLGFLVLPQFEFFQVFYEHSAFASSESFWKSFALFMLLLPNAAIAFYGFAPNISQAWSIGVEEQFYLIWPWLIRMGRNTLPLLLTFLLLVVGLKVAFLSIPSFAQSELKAFLAMTKIESMGIGGVGAWFVFRDQGRILALLRLRVSEIAAYVAIPILIYFTPVQIQDGVHILYAVCFTVIIVNVATNPNTLLRFEQRWLRSLGQISYGFYMYHMLLTLIVIRLFLLIFGRHTMSVWAEDLIIYGCSLILTTFVSYLSYHYFEKRFIRRKQRFSELVSGDDARKSI